MKKLFLLAACALMVSAASAQNYEKNIFGVRAGLNISNLTASDGVYSSSSNSRAAFHVGVTDQILLSSRLPFYLEPGIFLSSRGGKSEDATMRPMYIQVPVLLNYHFNIRDIVTIQPFAGVYYGLGICGKAKDKIENVKANIFGSDSGYKRSDFGVRLGAGVAYKHLFFSAGYEIGCLNLIDGGSDIMEGAKIRNNCFTLSVGYNF